MVEPGGSRLMFLAERRAQCQPGAEYTKQPSIPSSFSPVTVTNARAVVALSRLGRLAQFAAAATMSRPTAQPNSTPTARAPTNSQQTR